MNNQQKDFTKQDNKEIDSQNFKDFESNAVY